MTLIARGQATITTLNDGKDGQTGATGPSGKDANLLDWVNDWNTNKTVIGQASVITPKIFAGIKNANGTITGIALGNFDLTTINASGVAVTERINGLYGFKDGYRTFYIDNTGSAQLGRGNQFIKFNSTNGKIEFGSEVSLNWTNAANSALTSAKAYADTKKTEAISAAATDATNKANAVKEIAQLANDQAVQKVRYIRDWINGSTANTGNHWVQIMAFDRSGNNIALNKKVSGSTTNQRVTNGDTSTSTYASGGADLKNVVIDLGASYDIAYIQVWHYYADGRTYNDTKTECSVDGNNWYVIFDSSTEGKYKESVSGIIHYVSEYDRTTRKALNAQETADAITQKAIDEKWDTKLTYIDSTGIFTGTLSANTVNAIRINASQITAGTIDAARINVNALKASLITSANIEALTLNVVRGKIGGWTMDADSIYRGTKNNTAAAYTAASGSITIGSNGIRGFKWKLDSNGTGAIAGGNISWDATGKVTFASSVSLNWTNAADTALASAKSYADTKKSEAISAAATDAQTKANQAKADAINAASTDATNKVNSITFGGRNIIKLTNIGGTVDAGKYNDQTGRYKDISTTQWRIQNWTTYEVGKYSISFWAKADIAGPVSFDTCDQNGRTINVTTVWQYFKFENLNITNYLTTPYFGFLDFAKGSGSTIKNLFLSNLKLEYGTKCTEYTKAPEDIDVDIKNAQTAANTANTKLAEIANDNILPPSEKQETLKEWNIIKGEYSTVIAQANTFSVVTTTYTNAYNALNTYLTPLLSSLTANSTIVGTTFRNNFKLYYDAKIALLKLVTDKAKLLADNAQTSVNNLQIGGSNLLNNSGDWRTAAWNSGFTTNGGGYTIDNTVLYNGKPTLKTLVGTGLQHPWIKIENGVEYTFSAIVKCNETIAGSVNTPLHCQAGINNTSQSKITYVSNDNSVTANVWRKIHMVFKLNGDADSVRPFFYRGGNGTTTYWIANIKLERGNKATDWNPSISDTTANITEAKSAGTNAQAVADAITKKANDEKWATKLTYIDSAGIFTGTLSANTVNAIKINASQITAGTIDAARINVAALKTSLITAANIDALTLNVTKGKIGGWSIGADNITIGTLNSTSSTPIQIRSTTSGTSGHVYSGQLKPYGITMSWLQSSNAGHFILGQVMANGTTIKTGYIGIQMMAWDSTEYFCLSANHTKVGAKEIYNRIAGWAFDNAKIWKNNVALSADGSITNGNLWQINNNGSGRLANGNIVWDAAGTVTFGSSVSLNWTNAANSALTSAKSYADTKKTEAINAAATDATNKMNSAKNDGILYCKGTGLNRNANRRLELNGVLVYNTGGRGLHLTVIKKSDLSVLSKLNYDVYGVATERTVLANALNALKDDVIVVITSYDAIVIDTTLANALIRCGGSGILLSTRDPYALVGIPGIGKGNGIEVVQASSADAPYAEITTRISKGVPQGINSVQKIILEGALGGTSYPKLTKIDSTGIYTGTLTASQITAGTISADRIAAGSINASKLDATTIKSSIINTDYINGLTCTFIRGKIGGWSIGSDTITIGAIAAGSTPIQLRSSSTGTGYIYNGQFKPLGLTMSWHQSSNAGHFVFGQVMATGNTVKTGFIGIQMMSWDNQEYFCLSANYTKSGAKDFYNRIAGWAFDNDSIFRGTKNNTAAAYTAASGSITIGSNGIRGFKWRLDSTGAGAVAGGNITWDAAGNVTFGSSVTLNWTNAANSALTSAKSYADTKKTEAINSAAADATTKSDAAKELALAMAFGKMIYRDPIFLNGNNGINIYNNSNNGTVTITRTADNNAPNDSKQVLVIKNAGASSPNCGGFYWGTGTSYRKVYITRIIAKIPTGRNISYHSNSIGTGGTQKWLTPVAGTGDWCEYICKVICGTASFSSTHFFAITGSVGTAAAPVEWRVAYATVFDNTSTEKYTTTIDANGIYTGTVKANQVLVDSALVVGGSTYNGSVSVRDASNVVKVTLDRNGITAVGGTIGGWVIASNQISKNSVILGSDGTISNGTKWKLGNDGSGYVANGNVSWTAAGAVTITGTINATAGQIGGFEIAYGRIGSTASGTGSGGGLAIYNDLFRVGSSTSYAMLGDDTFPATAGGSFKTTARFTNTRYDSWFTNIGLYLDIKNARRNFGIHSNAALMGPSLISNKVKTIAFGSGSYSIDFSQFNRFFIYATTSVNVTMPSESSVCDMFGYSSLPSDFGCVFTFTYNYNYGNRVTLLNLRNQNGGLSNYAMEKGDTLTILCAKFPAFHYQVLTHYN